MGKYLLTIKLLLLKQSAAATTRFIDVDGSAK